MRCFQRVRDIDDEIAGINGVGVTPDQELGFLAGMLGRGEIQCGRLQALRIM